MADIPASTWSETDASNNTASPEGAPEGMAPGGLNNTVRMMMGAIKRWFDWRIPKITTGTSTAYLLTYTAAPGALVDGMTHRVQFHTTCGAAPTVNTNSLGAKPIYKFSGGSWGAVASADIVANSVHDLAYNAADNTGAGAHRVVGSALPIGMPALGSSNAFTGANDFTGGSIVVPTASPGDSDTSAASTAFVAAAVTAGSDFGRGFGNGLRNGTFLSWPGGTSGTIAAAATGAAVIAAAAWAVIAAGASVTWAQVTTGSNGSPQSLKVTGAASVTGVVIGQRIESYDAAQIAGKTCTFQVAVYNSTGGSITPTIATRYAGSADNWTSPSADLAATNLQACTNGAWTIVSYTLAVHASAINGYEVKLDFGNNFSTNGKYVQISAADFRATPGVATGLNASPPAPELPDVQTTLARCARYQQASYENGTAPGAATPLGMVGVATNYGQNGSGWAGFPYPMRTTPTVSYWDGAGNASKCSYNASGSSLWTDNATAIYAPFNISSRGFSFGTASGVSASAYIHFRAYADFW